MYTLSQDEVFTPFLVPDKAWLPRGRTSATRGFTDDGSTVAEDKRQTAQQKVATLEMMLGQIANYCPVISRNTIVKNSKSISHIYQTIRLHYGFQSSGAHFLDFADIRLEPEERHEDLYQRIVAFVEDNLLQKDSAIKHHDMSVAEDEEVSPTLENLIVLTWLRLVHPGLPKLVKQRYGTELRSRTLASIKPEISQALSSLIDELQATDESQIMRSHMSMKPRSSVFTSRPKGFRQTSQSKPSRVCPLCKQGGRPDKHYLSECSFLPKADRIYMMKSRQICDILDDHEESDEEDTVHDDAGACRIEIRASPFLDTFYEHHHVRVALDTGATGDMIRASTAKALGVTITKATQSAKQADGWSLLSVIGETRMQLTHGGHLLHFAGLVVENLDVDILAGMPFIHRNNIGIFPARNEILFGDGTTLCYKNRSSTSTTSSMRCAIVLRAPPQSVTVWPGDFIEVDLPPECANNATYALEARSDTAKTYRCSSDLMWPPPTILNSVAGKIRIPNLTSEPQTLRRNEHFCQALPTVSPQRESEQQYAKPLIGASKHKHNGNFSSDIQLDPDNILDPYTRQKFAKLHHEYDIVFDPNIPGYNGAMGPCNAVVNMGPVQPPQRKGRVPQYSRDKLQELQEQFDNLEALGVFKRPADIGMCAEYLNPSFLVKKASGGVTMLLCYIRSL